MSQTEKKNEKHKRVNGVLMLVAMSEWWTMIEWWKSCKMEPDYKLKENAKWTKGKQSVKNISDAPSALYSYW